MTTAGSSGRQQGESVPEQGPSGIPLFPAGPSRRIVGKLGAVTIASEADLLIEPGHQWLLFSMPEGLWLAAALSPTLREMLSGQRTGAGNEPPVVPPRALSPDGQWVRIGHDSEVDATLLRLSDMFFDIRINAPGLVQLRLVDVPADL